MSPVTEFKVSHVTFVLDIKRTTQSNPQQQKLAKFLIFHAVLHDFMKLSPHYKIMKWFT